MPPSLVTAGSHALDVGLALSVQYIPQVILAIIVLFIGLRLIKIVTSLINKGLAMERVDPSLRSFFESAAGIFLKILLLVSVASMVGVQTTSFIALLGAVGLAVGLSLQGSLGNLAGGILLLIFKPFVIGEEIQAQGHQGKVARIEIFSTILRTEEGRTVIIPNGPLSNGVIVNFSRTMTVPSVKPGVRADDAKTEKQI